MDGSQYDEDPLDVGWRDRPPTLSSFLGVVRRRALMVLLFMAVSIALALAAIVYAEPFYTARVTLYLDDERGAEPRADEAIAADLETQVQLIQSDVTTAAVVRELDLADLPEFGPSESFLGRVIANLRARAGMEPFTVEMDDPMPRVINEVRSGLDVNRAGTARMIDISYTSTSPEFAVEIVNAFAHTYVDGIAARQDRVTQRRIASLKDRAEAIRQKSAETDARIRTILENAGQFAVDPQDIERQNSALLAQLAVLDADVSALSTKRALVSNYEQAGDFSSFPIDTPESRRLLGGLAVANERLADLRQRDDASPQMTSATEAGISSLQARLVQEAHLAAKSIEVELDIKKSERDTVAAQIQRLNDFLTSTASVELYALSRDKTFFDNAYQDYLSRIESAQRDEQSRPNLRIVADALMPMTPSSPRFKVTLAIALTLGAFLGIGLAALLEWNRHDRPRIG